jgi:hypothetical protein
VNTRRNFLKLGALFVPAAIVEPRRVYSFLWAPRYVWVPQYDDRQRPIRFQHVGQISAAYMLRLTGELAAA